VWIDIRAGKRRISRFEVLTEGIQSGWNQKRVCRAKAGSLSLKIIDATDALLSVLYDFREKESESRTGDVCSASLVEIPVVDIRTIQFGLGVWKREAGGSGMIYGRLGRRGED
jgi:hypothetical protein